MILAHLALAVCTDVALPSLSIEDLAFGTSAPASTPPFTSHLGLVPGNRIRFVVTSGAGAAGDLAVLGSAPSLASIPLPLGSGLLLLDPAVVVILGSSTHSPAGEATFDFALPAGMLAGDTAATQAVTIDPVSLEIRTTNALTHVVTGLAPEVLVTFAKSAHPAAGSTGALLISDPAGWQAFWSAHTGGFGGTPPAVDFATKVVVVGFGGHWPSGGYSLKVDGVAPLAGGGVQVLQTLTMPGLGCGTTFGETAPGQAAAFDRVAGALPVVATTAQVQAPPCP